MSNKTPLSRRDFIATALAGGLGLGTLVLSHSAAAQTKGRRRFGTQNIRPPAGLRDNKNCPDQNTAPPCPTLNRGSNLPGRNLNPGRPGGTRNLGGGTGPIVPPCGFVGGGG
ncbi:MAG: twin-arginine translocation signal domain-containing protein [Rhodospirillales bacterium]|nr:twin-arginine translocation signal domain-containing protein [Rhodospirillales bacterium]